jgi:hypothetical protein
MENVLSNIFMFLPQQLRLPGGIRDMNVYVISNRILFSDRISNFAQDFPPYVHSCCNHLSSASSC